MMWWGQHMFGLGWGGWLLGGLMMLLFWGGLIALTFFLVRVFSKSGAQGRSKDAGETALDILKRRYARGEIGREEYEAIRRDLEQA